MSRKKKRIQILISDVFIQDNCYNFGKNDPFFFFYSISGAPCLMARIKQFLQTAQTSNTVYRYTVCGITGYINSASVHAILICTKIIQDLYSANTDCGLVSHIPLASGGL